MPNSTGCEPKTENRKVRKKLFKKKVSSLRSKNEENFARYGIAILSLQRPIFFQQMYMPKIKRTRLIQRTFRMQIERFGSKDEKDRKDRRDRYANDYLVYAYK